MWQIYVVKCGVANLARTQDETTRKREIGALLKLADFMVVESRIDSLPVQYVV